MLKKCVCLSLLVTFFMTAGYAFAEEVHVTPRGEKYHKEVCRLIKNKKNVIVLGKEDAVEEGYLPCKRCYKEDLLSDSSALLEDQSIEEKTTE